jgi:GT2 family glycosyltransferase
VAPSVLIVVVCFNRVADTLACLASLANLIYARYEVLVIDNASSDGTVEQVRARFPEHVVLETGANLGYAGGNNLGLRRAIAQGYDYALLLNNDAEVAAGSLEALIAAAEGDPSVGLAGPTIYYADRPSTIWSAGGIIQWHQGKTAMRGLDEIDNGQYARPAEVDFLSGCALLVKRAAVERVGLLDERFFLYYEDTEWCVRLRRAGFRVVQVPAARLIHRIPLDARDTQPYVTYYMTRNRLLFLQLVGAKPRTWLHAALLQDLRTYLSWKLRPKWRARNVQRRAMRDGWRDFARQRFGRSREWS